MTSISKIQATFEWVHKNYSGAIVSFALSYPFFENSKLAEWRCGDQHPMILREVFKQLPRYSALCLSRVWDKDDNSKTLKKLRNQVSQNKALQDNPEFLCLSVKIDEMQETPEMRALVKMRDKTLAHTEGVDSNDQNSFALVKFSALLRETSAIVDGFAKLPKVNVNEFPHFASQFDHIIADRTDKWIAMLSPAFESRVKA